jgi:X-X-X-Leu-X-X-Gly heptad repeat protein
LEELVAGSEELDAGSEELDAGSEELDAGSEELVAGSEELGAGSEELDLGSEELGADSPAEALAIEEPVAYTLLRDWGGLGQDSSLLLDGGTDHALQEPALPVSRFRVRRAESAAGGLARDSAPAGLGGPQYLTRGEKWRELCRKRAKAAKQGDKAEMAIDREEDRGRSTASEPGARRRVARRGSPAQLLRAASGPVAEVLPALRGLVHARTFLPVLPGERHADCSSAWVARQRQEAVRDFVDLTEGEKDFMTMWNEFMTEQVGFTSKTSWFYFMQEYNYPLAGEAWRGTAPPARRPGRLRPEAGGRAAQQEPLPPGETAESVLLSSIESPSWTFVWYPS